MHSFQTLRRDVRLLAHYLRPQWPRMALLAVILCVTIGVQVVTPLVASNFIDQATSGADLHSLIVLALLTMGLALAGQALAVAETYVAENVSWIATNTLRADLVARTDDVVSVYVGQRPCQIAALHRLGGKRAAHGRSEHGERQHPDRNGDARHSSQILRRNRPV